LILIHCREDPYRALLQLDVKLKSRAGYGFFSSLGAFPNENSLLKLLYMGIQNASKKWTMPIQNWNLTLSQLAICFE